MYVSTGKAGDSIELMTALQRGRYDHEFFGHFFLQRQPHSGLGQGGQLKWVEEANATVNVLATANRWGKTTSLSHGHFHSGIYKVGAEPFYLDADKNIDIKKFVNARYHTVHTAGDWETARIVWEESHKIIHESQALRAFIAEWPKSIPPHIEGINGFQWRFRTLGHDSRGIDGNSFYLITIDEAGWIEGLEEKMQNVILIRVADVKGRIWLVGTFKPGTSKDFYKFARRAAAQTGTNIAFDHGQGVDEVQTDTSMDSSIRKYLREFGIDLDEYAEALKGEY